MDWRNRQEQIIQSYKDVEKAFDEYKARVAIAIAEEELNSIAKERPITNDDIRDVLGLNEP